MLLQLVLPAMRTHPRQLGVQMAATACLYNLSKAELGQKVHLVCLREIVDLTLLAINILYVAIFVIASPACHENPSPTARGTDGCQCVPVQSKPELGQKVHLVCLREIVDLTLLAINILYVAIFVIASPACHENPSSTARGTDGCHSLPVQPVKLTS